MTELHPRRFLFRANATGVAANIRRPEPHIVHVQGCSAIPVTGGHHESKVEPKEHKRWVSHGCIATSASGDYIDADAGVATTFGTVPFDAVPTVTRAHSSVQDLSILGRVRAGLAAMGLVSHSDNKGQPTIRLDGCRFEKVDIEGFRLKITLADDFFNDCDTLDKLAAKHTGGLSAEQSAMFLPADTNGSAAAGFPSGKGVVKVTIVKKIEWEGEPHPKAEIHGHVVRLPNFGKIYFGEMFVNDHSRRLTMIRFQLGSDDGGEVTAAGGETSGIPFPPN
jgi:hypothetical protein